MLRLYHVVGKHVRVHRRTIVAAIELRKIKIGYIQVASVRFGREPFVPFVL